MRPLLAAASIAIAIVLTPLDPRAQVDLTGSWGDWDRSRFDVEDFAVGLVRFAGGATLTLELYDPNWPGRNDVTLTLDLGNGARGAPVGSFPSGDTVFAFFRVPYTPPKAPPP